MDLTSYRTMRDSGVPWLGATPTHWERRRLKTLLRPIDRRSLTGTETLLSLRRDHGIVVYGEHFSRPAQGATTIGYKIVNKGQLVINRLQANNGLVFDSGLDGLVSPDYSVFEPRSQVAMPYLGLLLRTVTYRDHFRRESTGLGTGSAGFLRLYDDRFLETPVVLPPIGEQILILRFLNHTDRRIRNYIRAKQKRIALFEEEKQAIIHCAVTRGLDPKARLKPSGVEWLGAVPEHWDVLALRRVTTLRCDGPFGSGLKSHHYVESGIRVVRLQNIGHGVFRDTEAAFIPPEYYATLGDHDVEAGDLLIAGLGDDRHPAGRACVAPASILPAMVKADCFRFRPLRKRIDPSFVALHLTATASGSSAVLSRGATRQRTNLQDTASRKIAVPPIEEQLAIAGYCRDSTSRVEEAIAVSQREIALVREYWTRLVFDVVTGKLDVRLAAEGLPDNEGPDEGGEVDIEANVEESADHMDGIATEAEA